ncbi:hypothetical protein MPTK1_7g02540 [Marchantia polymorpha subsp. ruderalis]|uniref:Uncharacterized protein n=2 Tax=Marchantia polymorpha TaxID=3197 RepID=A0AAF6BVE9_MARPO|nr:hypothetical protein MARPO_0088s0034 [Marchantia polymorpha]BBN15983.1 hypothetical protein Mp_7g02540 [Marchantia polymorpha subsp. ruderalis]|eukprot:PTQ33488.1 hypothetical protein MARPO_0088s0034 [Marchantia polymorpha]
MGKLRITLTALAISVLMFYTHPAGAQCGKCDSKFVESALLKCKPCPVCKFACFQSTCCYALGTLGNVTDACMCKAIYNLGLESIGLNDQFRLCSRNQTVRKLNCCLPT